MHTPVLPPWIGAGFFLIVCGAALWKGGRDERVVAVGLLLSWAVSYLSLIQRRPGTQWGEFAADALLLALLGVVALRSRRYWPLAAAAFQLLAVVTHAATLVDRHLGAWAYITANVIWTQLITMALAIGTYNDWRARRQVAAA
ncbi:MAG: hypothetical protein KGO51_13065 [Alphaproteobacteria bacterium]|nr:hypothetical protein [Alphaproteobacteria bacterium]